MYELMRKHIKRYNDFRRATGLTFKELQKLHEAAVREIDKLQNPSPVSDDIRNLVVSTDLKTMAYLTDIALEHLSVGASLEGHNDV